MSNHVREELPCALCQARVQRQHLLPALVIIGDTPPTQAQVCPTCHNLIVNKGPQHVETLCGTMAVGLA